jgi:hypothetical protein
VKPISNDQDDKISQIKILGDKASKDKPLVINSEKKSCRIGALEVQIVMKVDGRTYEKVLYSKLQCN